MKKVIKTILKVILILLLSIILLPASCGVASWTIGRLEKTDYYLYYVNRKHFVVATGTVSEIYNYLHDAPPFSKDGDPIYYLRIIDLSERFGVCDFVIEGENLTIAVENGLEEKLSIGDSVEIYASPRCFGDGYAIPLAGLKVDGDVLIDYETGYKNLLHSYTKLW